MDATLTAPSPTIATPAPVPQPVAWDFLTALARMPSFHPDDYGPAGDRKPYGFHAGSRAAPRCRGCGVRWPGEVCCGYCRNRVKKLRERMGGPDHTAAAVGNGSGKAVPK